MKANSVSRVVLALASFAMAAGVAVAQGPDGGGAGMGPGFGEHRPPMERAFGEGSRGQFWNNPKIAERLKLTDDQRKSMDAILLEHREKLVDLKGGVEKAELQMEPLMKADAPNESAILAQIDKIAQARAELEKANARFLLALRSKLTPEQWKQMQEFRDDHREGRGGWGEESHGQGPRGQGGQGQGGQFHRQQQGPPPPADAQPGAPAAPAPGIGDQQ
jgi:Spy/CpxP family protein refolding chaperone